MTVLFVRLRPFVLASSFIVLQPNSALVGGETTEQVAHAKRTITQSYTCELVLFS